MKENQPYWPEDLMRRHIRQLPSKMASTRKSASIRSGIHSVMDSVRTARGQEPPMSGRDSKEPYCLCAETVFVAIPEKQQEQHHDDLRDGTH